MTPLDPLLLMFLMLLIMVIVFRTTRVAQLYSSGITLDQPLLDSDYLYILLIVMLSYYPVSVLLAYTFGTTLIQFSVFGLYFYFILPTLIAGVIYTFVLAPIWYNTKNLNAIPGLFVSVMFGSFFSTYLAVGLNPDTTMIRSVYGYYTDVALDILKLVSTMAILPVLQRFVQYAYAIYKNNFIVSLRGALFSAIGGVFGFATLFALIPLFTSATVAGIFAGLLLRNNINNLFAPFLALIAVLGVPPFWHTFYEFTAFGVISASVGMIIYGLVSKRENTLKLSSSGLVVGSLILLFGAFNEVTISSTFAALIKRALNFSPVVSDVTISGSYIITFILSWFAVLLFVLLIIYFIHLMTNILEEVST